MVDLIGVPETIRTSDLALRRRLLYPAELPGQNLIIGGAEEDRTPDLCIANAALSQLSYGPLTDPNMKLHQQSLQAGILTPWPHGITTGGARSAKRCGTTTDN